MIYEQPVVYEFKDISVPILLIIGQADRTIVGKNMLTEEQKKEHGQYPELGKKINIEIKGSKLVELENVGHIPHVQEFDKFMQALFGFL